jgi:hypothetical protein
VSISTAGCRAERFMARFPESISPEARFIGVEAEEAENPEGSRRLKCLNSASSARGFCTTNCLRGLAGRCDPFEDGS